MLLSAANSPRLFFRMCIQAVLNPEKYQLNVAHTATIISAMEKAMEIPCSYIERQAITEMTVKHNAIDKRIPIYPSERPSPKIF